MSCCASAFYFTRAQLNWKYFRDGSLGHAYVFLLAEPTYAHAAYHFAMVHNGDATAKARNVRIAPKGRRCVGIAHVFAQRAGVFSIAGCRVGFILRYQ